MDRTDGTGDLWRRILEQSPVGMALVSPEGRFVVVNRAICDILGYEPDQLRRRCASDVSHPQDLEPSGELFRKALAGEIDSFRVRKRYVRGDGGIAYGDVSVSLVRDEDGTAVHFIAQLLDVTDEHDYEERLSEANLQLERERRTLEGVFDTVDVGLLLIDRDGTYVRMNRRHAATMKLSLPEGQEGWAGQPGHVYHEDGTTLLAAEEMPPVRAMRGEEFDDVRVWVGPDPCTRSAFSVSARTLRDAHGRRTGAALAYKEITQLMRALQVKDDFLASVSHELRTPLTPVLGNLEVLLDQPGLDPSVTTVLQVVERNARRLQTLVSDLLHVAHDGHGDVHPNRTQVDLVPLLAATLESRQCAAGEAGLSLALEAPASLRARVDAERIRQVVEHLLSNAIKFTAPGGSVTLRLRRDRHNVVLAVEDTGVGLDACEHEQVFTRFHRGKEAIARHIPGAGLGLSIARSIIVAHGGRLTVRSTPGVGSEFRVHLPDAMP